MTTGSDYPYRFERTTTIGPLRDRHSDLEPGTDTGQQVSVAGRVMTVRGHGKVGFADLVGFTSLGESLEIEEIGELGRGEVIDAEVVTHDARV